MTDLAAADRDAGIVEQDLACIGCDYNLRMQPLDAACPECGRPVRATLDFPRLERSAPRWLTSLLDSVTVLLVAFALDLGIVLAGVRRIEIALPLATVPWALTWFAIWALTRPEPGARNRDERMRAWTMRVLAILPTVVFFVAMANRWFGDYVWTVLVGLVLCGMMVSWLYYDHLRRAAERLPARALAVQARWLRWLVPLAALVSVVMLPFTGLRDGADLLHILPRPGMPAAWDVPYILNAWLDGMDFWYPPALMRLFLALTAVAAVAVLVQFRIAFARAAKASKRGGGAEGAGRAGRAAPG